MTKYTFKIQKRAFAEDGSDARITNPETFADAAEEALNKVDVAVKLYLDDVEQTSLTLGDTETDLSMTVDLSVGSHDIRVVPQKDPVVATDVMMNQFLIDDQPAVTTQWDFNNQIFGVASTLRQKLAWPQWPPAPNAHNKIWYGSLVSTQNADYSLSGIFYRPCIVSDHQSEWHLTVTRTGDGKLWIDNPESTESILYDSTANYRYYFAQQESISREDADTAQWYQLSGDSSLLSLYEAEGDNSSVTGMYYKGQGTYNENLEMIDSSTDQSLESDNRLVIWTFEEYNQYQYAKWYHENYSVTPFTTT